LAICTGTRARRLDLEGATLGGVHYLRTMADAAAIRAEAMSRPRVAIVGGGYIGLEVAASLRHLGCAVTVLEALPRVMARVVAPEVAAFYTAEHRRAGVLIETGVQLERLVGGERIAAVRARDGREWPADLVVIGIGAIPNDELARTAGLACDNGVVVDEFGATGDPAIWAAGDVTNHPSALFGRRVRLESVHNAMAQAKAVAAAIIGRPEPYDEVPWFWSDQYDLKLQIAGLSSVADATLLRGDPASRAFSCLYLAAGRLVAVDAINRPADFIAAKRLIAQRHEVDVASATDPDRKLGS
jgi:3-phenylpropionate/trans-cinnamate dioxygenase ferredoxin reductase subunit